MRQPMSSRLSQNSSANSQNAPPNATNCCSSKLRRPNSGVINSSHGDLAPVFDAMLEKAMQLCGAAFGSLYTFDKEQFQTAAQRGLPAAWADYRAKNPPSGQLEGPFIRLLETKRPVHITDIKDEEVYRNGTAAAHALVDLGGGRTVLYVPLLKGHAVLGTIVTYRQEVRPFTDKQIALLENFAAQAVTAMENARLFNETKEALEQQAATSDILRVISQSPTDVQPVFEAIVLTAVRLTGCDLAFFLRCDGATYSPTARATPEGLQTDARPSQPIDPDANFPSRAIVEKKTLHFPDWSLVDPPAYERWVRETFGIVSSLYLPLLCAGECIGLLVLAGKRTNIFGDREIALAESFARPGRDRDRECPPVRRGAGAHPRTLGIVAIPDGEFRRATRDQPITGCIAAGARRDRRDVARISCNSDGASIL